MRTIALINQKGGCAKTTTAVNLSTGLAIKGKKVLLVDMDPQANATSVFMDTEPTKTIFDILFEELSVNKVIIPTPVKNLFLLPSDINLSATDLKLAEKIGREKIFYNRIKDILHDYEYIIIDTPPSLGLLTINALTTTNEIIIPISTSYFAMKGVSLLLNTIELVRKNLEHSNLKITGVLCTMYDPVTNVSKTALTMIKDFFKEKVMKTLIRTNIKLEEAHSAGKSIFQYAPNSHGAEDYMKFTEEVLKNG
jgi:chromosome partitioning protein